MKTHTTTQQGFSLIETLVAITILLIVIINPMTISSRAAKSSSFSSEQVIAFFLAQEGLELAQKGRDDFLIPYFGGTNPDPWGDFTNTNGSFRHCFTTNGCGLTISTTVHGDVVVTPCVGGTSPCQLYYDTGAGAKRARYVYTTTAMMTPYNRRIYFENIGTDEVKVRSRVTWRTGSLRAEQMIEVETRLFNVNETP
jgi:prepilin-type N-terminal cleavage/methylation domain-containing protein